MTGSPSDPSDRLRNVVRSELQDRANVRDFEIVRDELSGLLVAVRDESGTHLYQVSLDRYPDGIEDTHWEYLGDVNDSPNC